MENRAAKTEKPALVVVAIDGLKIKTIRETKKLTQLYVATVVGVTTDTISRWENNRYPAIKRENAEKLASALEVELEEILLREDGEEPASEMETPPATAPSRRTMSFIIVATILVVIVAAGFCSRQRAAAPTAERKLPPYGAPGEVVPIQIKITGTGSSTSGVIVKERLPAGWRLTASVPPAATGQAEAEEIKWLIRSEAEQVMISYTVRIPPAAALQTSAAFTGEVVTHVGDSTRKGACGGDRTITVAGVHWADRNADGRVDDEEIMPAYYLTELKGLGLDWKQIEELWSGKGYRWNEKTQDFLVTR